MKRTAILLVALLASLVGAGAIDVYVQVRDLVSEPVANRRVDVTLAKPSGNVVSGPWAIAGSTVTKYSGNTGVCTFSNMLNLGQYQMTIAGNPGKTIPFTISYTNGYVNVLSLMGTNQTPQVYYTADQVDALMAQKSNMATNLWYPVQGTNTVLYTNAEGNIVFNATGGGGTPVNPNTNGFSVGSGTNTEVHLDGGTYVVSAEVGKADIQSKADTNLTTLYNPRLRGNTTNDLLYTADADGKARQYIGPAGATDWGWSFYIQGVDILDIGSSFIYSPLPIEAQSFVGAHSGSGAGLYNIPLTSLQSGGAVDNQIMGYTAGAGWHPVANTGGGSTNSQVWGSNVIGSVSQALHATNADNATLAVLATQASHATNADTATTAGSATTATSATSATVASKAGMATNAITATNFVGQLSPTNWNNGASASASTYARGDGTWGTPTMSVPSPYLTNNDPRAVMSTNARMTNAANFGMAFTSPGPAASSEQFGALAEATAVFATAVGNSSMAYGENSTALGWGAYAASPQTIALGTAAQATGTNAIALGAGALAPANSGIAIGVGASAAHSNSVALGMGALTTTPNQLMLGANGWSITLGGNATTKALTPTWGSGYTGLIAKGAATNENNSRVAYLSDTPRIFNVLDYGATLNGGTDDTTAIQSAVDAAMAAGGGVVYFPGLNTGSQSSTYFCTGKITVGNYVTIRGDAPMWEGGDRITGAWIEKGSSPSDPVIFELDGNGIVIKNLGFTGATNDNAIAIKGVHQHSRVQIQNCIFKHFLTPISLDNFQTVTVEHNMAQHCVNAILLGNANNATHVHFNYLDTISGYAIRVTNDTSISAYSDNLISIKYNTIETVNFGVAVLGNADSNFNRDPRNVSVTDNYFEWATNAVTITNGAYAPQVTGNIFIGDTSGGTTTNIVINGCKQPSLGNNVFAGTAPAYHIGPTAYGVLLEPDSFIGSDFGANISPAYVKIDGTNVTASGTVTASSFDYFTNTVANLPTPAAGRFPSVYCSDVITSRGIGGLVQWNGSSWVTTEGVKATADIPTFIYPNTYSSGLRCDTPLSAIIFRRSYFPNDRRTLTYSGSGATVVQYAGDSANGFFCALQTGTTTTGYAGSLGAYIPAITAGMYYGQGAVFNPADAPTLTDSYWVLACGASGNNGYSFPTTGYGFLFDTFTNTIPYRTVPTGATTAWTNNWLCFTANSSSYTFTDSGFPVTPSTFHRLWITHTNGAVTFYTNGVRAVTHTSNVPTTGLWTEFSLIKKTTGTTSRLTYEALPASHLRQATALTIP